MPYSEQSILSRPPSEATIWRFMNLSKFLDMVVNDAVAFVRVDLFDDKYEGYPPAGNIILPESLIEVPVDQRSSLADQLNRNTRNLANIARQIIFANCWHTNEHESAAMWKLYLQGAEGVAIRSTFARLKGSLSQAPQKIEIGMVEYLDYQTDRVEVAPMLMTALSMRKRKSFEHERELRAIHWDGTEAIEIISRIRPGNSKSVIAVPVNLDELVETVYVAPSAGTSYAALVRSVIEKYGLKKEVNQSSLASGPVW